MLLTWEAAAVLISWMLIVITAAVWIERRLSRLERDVHWIAMHLCAGDPTRKT